MLFPSFLLLSVWYLSSFRFCFFPKKKKDSQDKISMCDRSRLFLLPFRSRSLRLFLRRSRSRRDLRAPRLLHPAPYRFQSAKTLRSKDRFRSSRRRSTIRFLLASLFFPSILCIPSSLYSLHFTAFPLIPSCIAAPVLLSSSLPLIHSLLCISSLLFCSLPSSFAFLLLLLFSSLHWVLALS